MHRQSQGNEAKRLEFEYKPAVFDPFAAFPAIFFNFCFLYTKSSLPGSRPSSQSASVCWPKHIRGNAEPPSRLRGHGLASWRIDLPAWCHDQRNQMTGPADDAELVIKMLNSGAPGVMLDLEDSMANEWPHLRAGIHNILRRSGAI